MTSDSDRLAADGIPIVLADGHHTLRFTMRGLKVLEDRFEHGMDGVTEFLAGKSHKRFGPLIDMLAAGLVHEGVSPDEVEDLALPARYNEYLDAIVAALDEAFPSPTADSSAGATPKADPPSGSTGGISTTSPPSASVAAMSSSGA